MRNSGRIRTGTGALRRTSWRTRFCSDGALIDVTDKSFVCKMFASSPPAPAHSAHWRSCSSAPVAHTPIGVRWRATLAHSSKTHRSFNQVASEDSE